MNIKDYEMPRISAYNAINLLTTILLGEDWYFVDPVNSKQGNQYILYEIFIRYLKGNKHTKIHNICKEHPEFLNYNGNNMFPEEIEHQTALFILVENLLGKEYLENINEEQMEYFNMYFVVEIINKHKKSYYLKEWLKCLKKDFITIMNKFLKKENK